MSSALRRVQGQAQTDASSSRAAGSSGKISLSAVCIGEGLVLSILEGRGPTRGTLAARETSVAMTVDQELPVAHSGNIRGGKIFTELVLRKKNTEGNRILRNYLILRRLATS